MKRSALIRHLQRHGCRRIREGARHSWWRNEGNGRRSAVPRHREINDILARKSCRDLAIDVIGQGT